MRRPWCRRAARPPRNRRVAGERRRCTQLWKAVLLQMALMAALTAVTAAAFYFLGPDAATLDERFQRLQRPAAAAGGGPTPLSAVTPPAGEEAAAAWDDPTWDAPEAKGEL